MTSRSIILGLGMVIGLSSCNNDDDAPLVDVEPPRPLSEVAAENDTEIQEFLSTHFYNYEEFRNPPEGFDFRIRLDTISGENSDKEPLTVRIQERTVNVSASEFLLEGEENVPHKYYYLQAREGAAAPVRPTVGDSTFVRYQGLLLNGEVFDENRAGTWWNNPIFQFPGVGSIKAFRGVSEGVTNSSPGTNIIDNGDGTFDVEGYGVGMIIFPSALANFNGIRGSIPAYSPLIFKFDTLTIVENADHDGDGIPSILEDVDNDGLLVDENTDEDAFANFQDEDDDNDGILTIDEIEVDSEGNFIAFKDSDGDTVPDHLDPDN